MACASCRQVRCVCEDRAILGVPVTVIQPTGDDVIDNTVDCITPPCGSTPGTPTECQNYFKGFEGDNGNSFIFSAGGPFELTPVATCPSYTCPPPASGLLPLPFPSSPAFVNPGSLENVICVNLQPGTFNAQASFTIDCGNPGTRVVLLYRPDCDDPTVEFAIADCSVPCAPTSAGVIVGTLAPVTMQCSGALSVPNANCKPGFRIVQETGCAQCVGELSAPCSPAISNVQLLITRLSSRNLLSINDASGINNNTANINVFVFSTDEAISPCGTCVPGSLLTHTEEPGSSDLATLTFNKSVLLTAWTVTKPNGTTVAMPGVTPAGASATFTSFGSFFTAGPGVYIFHANWTNADSTCPATTFYSFSFAG